MRRPDSRPLRSARRLAVHRPRPVARAAAACLLAVPLWLQAQGLPATALPQGLQVVHGQAQVATQGAQMTVRNSAGAVLNWNSFNIGASAGVHFQQVNAASKVLNRVTGSDPSALLGSLTSNGQVWLLNPNGVLFGAGSRVDVAGLVASTLRLNDNDFLAGRYRFSALDGDAAGVRNEGALRSSFGGQVVLLGSHVSNAGEIDAPGGSVALAAARRVDLVDTGLPNLRVQVEAPVGEVLNLGALAAAGGAVDVYAGIVNQQGLVQADTLGTDAQGRITLHAGDTLMLGAASRTAATGMAEGAKGGRIDLLAPQVGVVGRAEVDASGAGGGGGIRLGGGFQGKDAEVPNARAVVVTPGAWLRADATTQGDGGRVIVWADEGTRFAGGVSARGAGTGDGGFAEVSGKGTLEYTGRADLSAPLGIPGTLLLDPQNIVIQAANPNIDGLGNDLTLPTVNFNDFSGTSVITAAAVNTQLSSANVTLQAQIDITVDAPILRQGTNSLTLQAGRDITVNAPIEVWGGINLYANDPAPAASALGKVVVSADLNAQAGVLAIRNEWGGSSPGTHVLATSQLTAGQLLVQGPVQLGSMVQIRTLGAGSTIEGDISGSGGLTKTGPFDLALVNQGSSTYSGATDIQQGTLRVSGGGGSQVLGLGMVLVASGATLDLSNGAFVANDMTLSGGRVNVSQGAGELIGNLLLASDSSFSSGPDPSAYLAITSTGNLGGSARAIVDAGEVRFESSLNSHIGGTTVTGGAALSINDVGALGSGELRLDNGRLLTNFSDAIENPVVLGSGGGTLVSQGSSYDYAGGISGPGRLRLSGSGDVTLSAAATHGGGTFVGDGSNALTVTVSGEALPAGGSLEVASNATLVMDGSLSIGTLAGLGTVNLGASDNTLSVSDGSFDGALVGGGVLVKAGTGTLTFSGVNTYTGGTTIQAGRLDVSGPSAVVGAGLITIESAGVLGIVDTAVVDNDVRVRNGATIDTAPGASPFFVKGTLGSGGALILDDGATLNLGAGPATASLTTYLEILRPIAETPGGSPESVNVVTRTKFGQDLVHTYSGGTTISTDDGRAAVQGAAARLGTGPINLVNRGNLDLDGVSVGNAIVVSDGYISSDQNPATVTGPVSVSTRLVLYGNSLAGGLTVSSTISGTGDVELGAIGGGNPAPVTLTGSNTYGGTTTVSGISGGARVARLAAGALPSGSPLVVEPGGVLELLGDNTAASATVAGTVQGVFTLAAPSYTLQSGAVVNANLGAGTLDVAGNATLNGTAAAGLVNLNGGTLTLGAANRLADAATLTVNAGATLDMGLNAETITRLVLDGGTLTNGGTLTGATDHDLRSGVVNVGLGGSVALLKTTAGTVQLTQANSYTSGTSVGEGTLVTTVAGALPASGIVFVSGGTLDLGGTTQSVQGLDLSGGTIADGTLSFGQTSSLTGGQLAAGAVLGGTAGALVNGNVLINGQLTYTGTTWLQAGTLTIDSDQTLSSLLLDGGTLGGTGDLTVTGSLAFQSASVALQGAGTLTTQGSTTVNMSLENQIVDLARPWINQGFLVLSGDDQIVLSAAGPLTNAPSGLINLTGIATTPLTGGTGAVFTNAGTLNQAVATPHALSASLSFVNTGFVDVNAGSLTLPPATTQSGVLSIQNGSTLRASGPLTNAEGGVIQGEGTLDMGAFTLTNQGTIRPGITSGLVGALAVIGNVDLATGTLEIELGGTAASQSDLLAITGDLALGGALNTTLIGGYTPVNADFVPVVTATGARSGNFAALDLPAGFAVGYSLAAGEAVRLIYTPDPFTKIFTNAIGDLDWGTAGNWAGGLPGVSDTALISAGYAVTHASGNNTIAALTVGVEDALTVTGGSLGVTGATFLDGALTVTGTGAVTLGGPLTGSGTVATAGGTLTLDGATTIDTLLLVGGLLNGNGSLTVTRSFNRSGGASVGSGFASVDITQATGPLQPQDWTAGSLTFRTLGVTTADTLLVDGALIATSGDVTLTSAQDIAFQSGTGSVTAAGQAALSGASQVHIGGSVVAQRIQVTSPGVVQITGGGGLSSNAASGDGIVLTGAVFSNTVGAAALSVAGGSRWLVYSVDPALDTVGGLATTFRQYDAPGGTTPLGAGNGLLYAIAPTLEASLQGTVSKVYDRSTAATLAPANYAVTGALVGDTVALNNPVAGSYDTASVGAEKAVTVTGIAASAVDSVGGYPVYGYAVNSTAEASIGTVTAALLPVTGVVAVGKVYDGTATATLGGVGSVTPLAGDTVTLAGTPTASFSDKSVGTAKPVTVVGYGLAGADAGNYVLVPPAGLAADITPLALPLTGLAVLDKIYDATTDATLVGTAVITPLSGDLVTLSGTALGSFVDKHVGASKPVLVGGLTLTGADAGNYQLTPSPSLSASISPVFVPVIGMSVGSKVYDGNTNAPIVGAPTVTPLAGDVVSVGSLSASFSDKNVGTGKLVGYGGVALTGPDAGNYVPELPVGAMASITPLALPVTGLVANSKGYDATTLATLNGTAAISPLAGDTVLLAGSAAATFSDKNVGTGKAVAVSGYSLTGADAGNYALLQPTGLTADITVAPLALLGMTAVDKVYDGNTVAPLAGIAAIAPLAGDVVTLAGTVTGSFGDRQVGTNKGVAIFGLSLAGADAANYQLVFPAGANASITPAPLPVFGMTVAGKVYDGNTNAPIVGTPTVTPLAGDVVSVGSLSASFSDKNVGTGKLVGYGGVTLTGPDAGNYVPELPVGAMADITPLALNVTGLTAADKVYDATTVAPLNGTAVIAPLAGDAVTLSGTARGSFADPRVGTNKRVSIDGLVLSGNDAGNYRLEWPAVAAASITPATLTYVADALTLPAGGPLVGFTGSVTGFLGSDTLAGATSGILSFGTPATPASPAGRYAIQGSGLAAADYLFVQAPDNATALTLTPAVTSAPATSANQVATALALQSVQLPLAMSSPTQGRVLDVTPALAPPGDGPLGGGPSFRAVNFSFMPRDEVQSLLAARAGYKKKVFATSLSKLEIDPALADVPACRTEAELGTGNCLITEALKKEIEAVAARAVVRAPKAERRKLRQAALPDIERKRALLIGINQYRDPRVPELGGAIPDARAVRDLLESRLGYETTVLENPTRDALVRALNQLALQTDANDSVVVYYAGHGEVVPVQGEDVGYWLPSDVNPEDPTTWLSNSDIARMVAAIGSRQLMLISDSCYSGTLVGKERVQLAQRTDAADLLKRRAAVVLSSGGNEPVADEGRDGHSVFAWHLMRALEGLEQWQVGSNVFERVRDAVVKDFPQTPQYGASRTAGHQGNTDYLFERREFEAPVKR